MLQIRLSRVPSNEVTGGLKSLPAETVTVACPDHLVLADLPVAKGIGGATAASLVKSMGRKSRRQLGERVHFCVRCDFPIAIYGRLSPCEHAFCLDCARSDSICYLCDERIQKIQTIKIMEGIFICAAPHCLKSFLKRSEFESHIHESHGDLLQSNKEKEDPNESEAQSNGQSTASEYTVRGPPKAFFSPQDREDKAPHPQLGDPARPIIQPKQPPLFGQLQNNQSETSHEKPGPHGILSDTPFAEYPPMHTIQPPNYVIPINSNPTLTPPLPYGYPPFAVEGAQQPFYSASYEMPRQDSTTQGGPDQAGSLLGFPLNFSAGGYSHPWNSGQVRLPFDPSASAHGIVDGFSNMPGSQAWQQNPSMPQGGVNAMDMRDGKGILAPQKIRGNFYPSEASRDGYTFGWQHENRDSFGSGQD